MNKEVKKNWYTEYKLLGSMISVLCIGTIITACSKNTPADEPNPTAISNSAPASSTQPTGLVKNPISHNKVADVTQWMDQASTKTAAQLAQEEKLAKEQKEVKEKQILEAKRASDGKTQSIKSEGNSSPSQSTAAQVTKTTESKPVEPAPIVVAAAPSQVASVPLATKVNSEPERVVLKLVNNVPPKFPVSAAKAGVSEGTVSARIQIDTDGKVSKVEILKARPTKVFEKEVISALSQWKYAPIPNPQTAVVEFSFKGDQ